MDIRKKATVTATNSHVHGKDRNNLPRAQHFPSPFRDASSPMKRVKSYFLLGNKGTAIEINNECFTGDARKIISDLRAQGWKIEDVRIHGLQKLYWLDHEQRVSFIHKGGLDD